MLIHTIGFTKKSAMEFFSLLKDNHIEILIDIRLRNISQLAGFSKGNDLEYFLEKLTNCKYSHDLIFAPTQDLLDKYKKKECSWLEYEQCYRVLMQERASVSYFWNEYSTYKKVCFLCSEPKSDKCHRRLLAEMIKEDREDIFIKHL